MTRPTGGGVAVEDDRHLHRLARGSGLNLIGAATSSAASFGVIFVVTNAFDQATAGGLFAGTALFMLIVTVAGLGADVGLARWVPHLMASGRTADVRRCMRSAGTAVLVTSGVAAAVMAVPSSPLTGLVGGDAPGVDLAQGIRVLAAFVPVMTVFMLLLAATRAYGTMRPTVVVDKIVRSTGQVVLVVVAAVIGTELGWLAAAWALPLLPATAWAGLWLRRVATRARDAVRPHLDTAPDGDDAVRAFWRFTLPRALGQVVQTAIQRVDVLLIAALLGVRDAAVYTAATRFMVFGQMGIQAIQQMLQPQLSRLFADGDHPAAKSVFAAATTWTILLTWPPYILFAGLAPSLLVVFGDGYGEGATTVSILCAAMLVSTATGPVDVVLLMAGRSGLSLGNNAVALVLNVVLNIVLLPRVGITGAAIAWSVAIVVRNLLPLWQIRREVGFTLAGGKALRAAVLAGATFGPAALVARSAVELRWAPTLVLVGVATAAYGLGVWRARGRLEVDILARALRRRRTPTAASRP